MRLGRERGFTLIEIVIALSIVGALLVIMFGGLRVGLGAWRRGEDRAELLEHERNVDQMVDHAVTGSYLYNPGTSPAVTNRPTMPPAWRSARRRCPMQSRSKQCRRSSWTPR